MPTDPAGLVSQLEGARGTKLDPVILVRVRRSLHRGDRAFVRRTDGSLVVFRVTAVRLYRKDRFPTAAVYGPAAGPQLRLITCGGMFDPTVRSYESNVVVYAVAAGKVA